MKIREVTTRLSNSQHMNEEENGKTDIKKTCDVKKWALLASPMVECPFHVTQRSSYTKIWRYSTLYTTDVKELHMKCYQTYKIYILIAHFCMRLGSLASRQSRNSQKKSLNVTFEILHKKWLLGLDCNILQLKGITFLRREERRGEEKGSNILSKI